MSVEQKVRDHFHADAVRFDAIYEEDKNPIERFIDHVLRGVVRRRLDVTLEKMQPLQGKTVLDVGCGSGRFCLAYAEQGASHVLGVDFAPAMIELANQYAKKLGVQDRCEFRVGAFPETMKPNEGPYDYSSACGFFDYIENPVGIIRDMKRLTRTGAFMSFPKENEWRVPLRRMRFKKLGVPLFLYTEERVKQILKDAGFERYDWINMDRDYLVIGRP